MSTWRANAVPELSTLRHVLPVGHTSNLKRLDYDDYLFDVPSLYYAALGCSVAEKLVKSVK